MMILMRSDMPGVTEEDYGHLATALLPALRSSDGFISHAAGPIDGGYRVTELWESAEAHRAWFEGHVRPLLPPDAPPPTISTLPITTIATRD
jgi:heme-degrading monooxygenase HmoA